MRAGRYLPTDLVNSAIFRFATASVRSRFKSVSADGATGRILKSLCPS
ncbi:hypothetical protein Fuma_00502 [Fuerstiella marisgermanici]|uniref:Uncharacterized protein n=1 Tax=Fuerstiella marisgermanici TaxID=1891926 RepID=A0A1P8WA41_9PLAN|nr:hypothetical protein Fuma_00502 [Fuerstiella marisgermanici]